MRLKALNKQILPRYIAAFLAMAFVLRSLVAPGFMLVAAEHGSGTSLPSIVLCPTQNPDIPLDKWNAGSSHQHHHNHDEYSSNDQPSETVHVEGLNTDCALWAATADLVELDSFNHPFDNIKIPENDEIPGILLLPQKLNFKRAPRAPPAYS